MKISELFEAEHPLDVQIAKQMAIEYVQENRPKFWAEGNAYAEFQPEEEDPDEMDYHAHRIVMDPHVSKMWKKTGTSEFIVAVDFWFADPKDRKDGLDWRCYIYVDIDKNSTREVTNIRKWLTPHIIPNLFDGSEEEATELAKRFSGWMEISL